MEGLCSHALNRFYNVPTVHSLAKVREQLNGCLVIQQAITCASSEKEDICPISPCQQNCPHSVFLRLHISSPAPELHVRVKSPPQRLCIWWSGVPTVLPWHISCPPAPCPPPTPECLFSASPPLPLNSPLLHSPLRLLSCGGQVFDH